ncbi:delta(14)-sterol reductase TM7SF2 [Hyalella azteca]|uniref:Delta(14)-sterol reductase TM7SF2 n=1 Tax=Hyalella azteca TaxID=294128 RepID=A0A8B7NAQ1_HYAAZ|nr:delta(14)-sterol reductase TM7SF2 [Hyalella azteca]XP_018010672.1 delta(14)-sterol reductase TM7SF2 [Hyalella azteca]XP_018010673.1 delta(14)-sterol reductase TM7SF2 [Hyalella azteca]
MTERKFNIGERVRAKWPGSGLYFEGEIEDFNDIEYLVKFDDEDESKLAVKYRDVAALTSFKRSRSRSRGRSPTRVPKSPNKKTSKSPGRVQAAKRSPGRPRASSKSPARISKTEITMLNSTANSSESNKSPSRASSRRIVNSSASSSFSQNSRSSNEEKTRVTSLRQSPRLSSDEKSNDVKNLSAKPSSSSGSKTRRWASIKRALATVWDVLLPALTSLPLIIFIALAPLTMSYACTKKNCTVLEVPTFSSQVKQYYDIRAVAITLGLLVLHLVLSYIPVRSRVLPNGAKARTNGLVLLLVSCLLFPLAHYFKLNVSEVYTLLRPLIVSHAALGLVFGLALYIKSFYAPRSNRNPRIVGHFLPDFIEGREVNPRIGSIDIKSFFIKHSIIVSSLLLLVLVIREFQLTTKANYNNEFFVLAALQLFYCLDFLLFEENFYSTWEYTRQGSGYFLTGFYLTMPYYFIVNTRVLMMFRSPLPWYCIAGIVVIYLAGYILVRGANNQKHAFRTNPSDPNLAHLESLPTSAGTRLLVSGWWGVVRHPNYLGDLLVQLSLCLLCGFKHGLPWLNLFLSFASLLHRIYETERTCSLKYGLSWSTYTGRVKYKLLPKVF